MIKTKPPSLPPRFRKVIGSVVGSAILVGWLAAYLWSGRGWTADAARNLVSFVSSGAIRIASPPPISRAQAEYDAEHGSEGGTGMR